MTRIYLVLLAVFALLLAGFSATSHAVTLNDRLVLANKMQCFPPLALDPSNDFWWSLEVLPPMSHQSSRPTAWCSDLTAPDMKVQGYVEEMNEAKAYGIDGFIVDITTVTPSDIINWTACVKAAGIVGDFWVCIQPDLTTGMTPQAIKPLMDATAKMPGYLKIDGKPLIAPYCVGYALPSSDKAGWVDWYEKQGLPISYIPSVFLDIGPYPNNDLRYRDPRDGYQTFASGITSWNPMAGNGSRQMAVDFWQGSGLGFIPDITFQYQNIAMGYLHHHGTQNFRETWQFSIDNRDKGVQWVMPNNWNDFNESAFCPNSNLYMALAPISKYYADWFKSGKKPIIPNDVVSIFHRIYPDGTVPSKYPYLWATHTEDEVEACALLTAPATIHIQTGDKTYSEEVKAGVQTFTKPFEIGLQKAWIERNGVTVASVTSPTPIVKDPIFCNAWTAGYTSAYPPEADPLKTWTTISGDLKASGRDAKGTGLAFVGDDKTLIDYRVTAKVTPTSGANGTNAGVVITAHKDGFFSLEIGCWNGTPGWRLGRWDTGVETALLSGKTSYAAGVAHKVRIDRVGYHLICYLDDEYVGTTEDWGTPGHTDALRWFYGQGGVMANGAPATFSDFVMERYQANMSNIAAMPTLSVAPGRYDKEQSVAIETASKDATIRYTTDGSIPTEATGTIYRSPMVVNSSETINAIACKAGSFNSYVRSGEYVIGTNKGVAPPSFSLAAGSYPGAQRIAISSATPNSTIRYTTDGTTPTPRIGIGGPSGTAAVIGANCTLKAIAYANYLENSEVKAADYKIAPLQGWIQVGDTDANSYKTGEFGKAAPVFSSLGSMPADFAIKNGKIPNMKVTYQLDVSGGPNAGSQTCRSGLMLYSGPTPDIQSGLFSGNNDRNYLLYGAVCDPVGETIPPEGVKYYWDQTKNSVPQEIFDVTLEVYNGIATTTLKSIAPPNLPPLVKVYVPTEDDLANWTGKMNFAAFRTRDNPQAWGAVSKLAFYRFAGGENTVASPILKPASGSAPIAVQISSATPEAEIRYTTNGSTPTPTSGTVYTGSVKIDQPAMLKAIAFKQGMSYSPVSSGDFTRILGISNGSFEYPILNAGDYKYTPEGATWSFTKVAGIAAKNSPFIGASAPDGAQVGMLQGTSSMSQQIFAAAGSHTVTFAATQRPGNKEDFDVLIDKTVVGKFTPGETFQSYSTSSFTFDSAPHTITFLGLNTAGGDNTAVIDKVILN